jgi:hypothetical protein
MYVLPIPPDDAGRVAVYNGTHDDRKNMTYSRVWCAALKPVVEPPPKVRDWDQLAAFALGGGLAFLSFQTLLLGLEMFSG